MADAPAVVADAAASPSRSPAARRFLRHRGAVVRLALVLLLVLAAALGPVSAPCAPDAQDLRERREPPSREHWFGTDEFGRDVFSRVLHGARVSLLTGLVPVATGLLVGTGVGLLAGFYRGWVDDVLMRAMDVLLAFPPLLLALAVVGKLGPGLVNADIAVAVVSLHEYARLARSVVIAAREEEY